MRLIDADALLNRMQEDPLFYLVERYGISGVINAEPTVDAVSIIRCKDCRYRDEQSANCTRFRKDWYVQGNSFCSWAERKEE